MLARILKTKFANGASRGRNSLLTDLRGLEDGTRSTTASSKARTPKLFIAEPTKRGLVLPSRKLDWSCVAPTASKRAHSSMALTQS